MNATCEFFLQVYEQNLEICNAGHNTVIARMLNFPTAAEGGTVGCKWVIVG
jgi:hypothetical protein